MSVSIGLEGKSVSLGLQVVHCAAFLLHSEVPAVQDTPVGWQL